MGTIRVEVREQHLSNYPDEEELLKPFLEGFYVTWGRRRIAYNTEVSVYFLSPEPFITEAYGFSQELLLVYAPYSSVQPRTIQAAESFLTDEPGRGRVEKLNYFIITEMDNVQDWIESYTAKNQESRIIVGFSADELRNSRGDSWFVRNALNRRLFGRDLFDYRLPLEKDTYFFGRADILANYFNAVKRSENRGLFGLRKTGKTSLLFKLERMLKAENAGVFLYYDCKFPSIRKLRWFELLSRISHDVSERTKILIRGGFDEVNAADTFASLVSRSRVPIIVVFDEIEYISPIARNDMHWHHDFVDFWQTFWACQSRHRMLAAIVAGVNPTIVEMDTINGIQNPLFGIVPYQYLTGLSLEETGRMIRTLGNRMGLKFEQYAIQYLHKRYGGHPLLTRIACSLINTDVRVGNETRPVKITQARLSACEEARDSDLTFYCRHVVSELQQFYPNEYSMLEMLSSGQTTDFIEFAGYSEFTKHLESYGLLSYDEHKLPMVSIPVVGRYVGIDLANREGRRTIYKVIDDYERGTWLGKRVSSIIHDLRFLEKLIERAKAPLLFGVNSFPEAESFTGIKICGTEDDFDVFINACNRCFVESIENYGRSIAKPSYFWNDIKTAYSSLFFALNRIKIYRVNHVHLKLNSHANNALLEYLKRDLENRNPSQIPELYFVLQQCVLDGLLTGIQVEINRLS